MAGSSKDRTNEQLEETILACVRSLQRDNVVSTNKAIEFVRRQLPNCVLSDAQLARAIAKLAIKSGFVPVFDPRQKLKIDQELEMNTT